MAQFSFELVSPEERLISGPAFQVEIPGQAGDLGVRAGHASFIVAMRPGIVSVQSEEGAAMRRIFVAGGFADIGQDHVTILAEEAVSVSDIKRDNIELQLRHLDDETKLSENAAELSRITSRREILTAMLGAAQA